MNAYIIGTGSYLPGDPIDNEQIEPMLGLIHGKKSRLKRKILASNGIQTRHYALDSEQRTTESNASLAAKAAFQCLRGAGLSKKQIGLLSTATSQGDLVLPGFASMVQAEMALPDVEISSSHGICSSSLMALKNAYLQVLTEQHRYALVVASELSSRLFKASRYEACADSVDFNAEFLRWMLSDGAGALAIASKPFGRSYRIEWIKGFSHADAFPVCMSVGRVSNKDNELSWQDYPTYADAEAAGALLIRQDVRLLENIVKLGVDGYLRLLEQGDLQVNDIDHVLCHYSSDYFRGRIVDMLTLAGVMVPEHKWFSNLAERGNTGCASIFIMLDEFIRTVEHNVGDTILCMVPESGRFNNMYMKLTVVEA